MPWPRDVRHIALCGWPQSGKSKVAEFLEDEFGGVICDDGLILRRALPILTGIDPEDPFSQEGKARRYKIGEREETVRQGLGELGNYLEARYGDDIIPIRTMELAQEEHPNAPFYIYPSCRKAQGRAYKRMGGVIIEIDNPKACDSGNDFDRWDRSCVDLIIRNDPDEMSLDDLRDYVTRIPELLDALSNC